MIFSRSYKISFCIAVLLHLFILVFLLVDNHTETPVLMQSNNDTSMLDTKTDITSKEERVIKAVSVDSNEVLQEINRLENEKARKRQAELDRQKKLKIDAELARKKLVAEQNRVAALKKEAAKLEAAKKRQLAEEKKREQDLIAKKQLEEKKLAEIKAAQLKLQEQKENEAKKLAEIKNKKIAELAKIERAKEEKRKAELAQIEQEKAQLKEQANKAEEARIAGIVDKYKALIINAIGQKWILPENANSQMSSKFRIHLAPNGVVLDVSLISSSGDSILDRSARDAIYKASPLPVPNDPKTFNLFRDISLTVRPGNARG